MGWVGRRVAHNVIARETFCFDKFFFNPYGVWSCPYKVHRVLWCRRGGYTQLKVVGL